MGAALKPQARLAANKIIPTNKRKKFRGKMSSPSYNRGQAEENLIFQNQNGFTRASDLFLGTDLGQFKKRIVKSIHIKSITANRHLDPYNRTKEGDIFNRAVEHVGFLFHRHEIEPFGSDCNLNFIALLPVVQLFGRLKLNSINSN